MKLKLVISDNCPACIRTKELLISFAYENKSIDLSIENLHDLNQQGLCIVPALFVDDELYLYGEIDRNKLTELMERGFL